MDRRKIMSVVSFVALIGLHSTCVTAANGEVQVSTTSRPMAEPDQIRKNGRPSPSQNEPSGRQLPFGLQLPARPPSTLDDLENILYRSIPEEHLRRISQFVGAHGHDELMSRYQHRYLALEDLYRFEILATAWRHWGFTARNNPFRRAITCIGETEFPFHILLHLGFRYIRENASEGDEVKWEVFDPYARVNHVSRRLFDLCGGRRR